MRDKIKNYFLSLLSEDMANQARRVELLTIIVFFFLLFTVWSLWNYKIELTAPSDGGRVVIAKMNIFELLLSKK